MLVAAIAALLVMGWSGSASAQAPPCSASLPPDEPTIWEYPDYDCSADGGAVAASCVHQEYPELDQWHEFADCEATTADGVQAAVATCYEDRFGSGYYTKESQCSAAAAGAAAGCHRSTAYERGSSAAPDTIECSATASDGAATCTRADNGDAWGARTVTDDCTVTVGGVSRSVHHDEGPDAPQIPDPLP